jgi:hypothetical protein
VQVVGGGHADPVVLVGFGTVEFSEGAAVMLCDAEAVELL